LIINTFNIIKRDLNYGKTVLNMQVTLEKRQCQLFLHQHSPGFSGFEAQEAAYYSGRQAN
jgi:hypothetical protein